MPEGGHRQPSGAALARRSLAWVVPLASVGERCGTWKRTEMIRWLLAVFVALVLINSLTPWLQRIGLGRLPGDFKFRLFGRHVFVPLASTVLVSVLVGLLLRWL